LGIVLIYAREENPHEFSITKEALWGHKGKIEGLSEGIELDSDIRFGDEGLKVLPDIQKNQDINVLTAVHRGAKIKNTLEDLRQIYNRKEHHATT